jgi:hypothetical protein
VKPWAFILAGIAIALAPLLPGEVTIPLPGWGVVTPVVTAAVYVHEQRDGGVPSGVMAGLNRLNREKGIVATVFDDDGVTGEDTVPLQYREPLQAAREAGLPAFVVMGGGKVLRVVKAPTTADAIVEAVE